MEPIKNDAWIANMDGVNEDDLNTSVGPFTDFDEMMASLNAAVAEAEKSDKVYV